MSDIEHISVTKTINGQQVTEVYDIVTSGGDANMSKATYDVSPATKAHAVDDFIYFNSHVYKVTSAISIGDSIAVGTNITADLGLEGDTQIYIDDIPGGGGGGGTGSPNFVGTTAEWNALSAAEKAAFDKSKGVLVNLSDDSEASVPIVTHLGGSVIHGNKIFVPLEKNTITVNNITLQSIDYCGINSIMACTPIKVESIDNAFVIEVSENIGSYIGYYAVITISHS